MVKTLCIILFFSLLFLHVHSKVLDQYFVMYVVLIFLLEIGFDYCYQILGLIQLLNYFLMHLLEVGFRLIPWPFCVPFFNALCQHFKPFFWDCWLMHLLEVDLWSILFPPYVFIFSSLCHHFKLVLSQ